MAKIIIICGDCNKKKPHHAKGLCYSCYKKKYVSRKIICENCGREKNLHAKGLCSGCYNTIYFGDYTKNKRLANRHKIDIKIVENFRETGCIICGWKKSLDIHHIDQDKNNSSIENLLPLCPNHHKALHSKRYQKETIEELKSLGIEVPSVIVQEKNSEIAKEPTSPKS